jgi:tetratricopeptide (TPR) repeat protein
LLTRLVDKSLVAVDREHIHEPRYYLLETIRQYAREKLVEGGGGEQIRSRHLDYFLKLAERAEPEIYGARQIEWSQKMEDEYENTRAALEWSISNDISRGQQLAAALWWSWHYNGHQKEGYEWLEKMLAAQPGKKTITRAKLLSGAGWFASWLGFEESIVGKFCEASIVLFRQLGDEPKAALSLAILAGIALFHSDYDQATALIEKSRELFTKAGNRWGLRHDFLIQGHIARHQGKIEQAEKFYEESRLLSKEIGDQEGVGVALGCIAIVAEIQGNDEQAIMLYEEALQIERGVNSKIAIFLVLSYLGLAYIRRGEYQKAKSVLEEEIELCRKTGNQAGLAYALQALGMIACHQENVSEAGSVSLDSLQLLLPLGNQADIAECMISIARFLAAQGSYEKFARLLGGAEAAVPNIGKLTHPLFLMETEKCITNALTGLGNEAYAAAYHAGKQMSLDESVAYALKALGQ